MNQFEKLLQKERANLVENKLKQIEKPSVEELCGVDPHHFTLNMMMVIERTSAYAKESAGGEGNKGFNVALILEIFKAKGFWLDNCDKFDAWLMKTFHTNVAELGLLKWFLKCNGLPYEDFSLRSAFHTTALIGPALLDKYNQIVAADTFPQYPNIGQLHREFFEPDKVLAVAEEKSAE